MQAIYAHPLVAELLAHSVPHQAAPEKSPESESALDDNLETKFDPSILPPVPMVPPNFSKLSSGKSLELSSCLEPILGPAETIVHPREPSAAGICMNSVGMCWNGIPGGSP